MHPPRWATPADLLAALATALFSLIAVGAHMQAFATFSPFDEATHIDYVFSMSELELPALGTPYDDRVLREWSCRGGWSEVTVLPPCESTSFDHTVYPARGIQRNPTGPLYYATVALVSQPIVSAVGGSPLGAARLTGAGFLFLSSLITALAAQKLGASRALAWATAALVPLGMPLVLHATSTVNSDAGVLLIGALILPFALQDDQTSHRWRVGVLVLAMGAALTKQTALFPVGALAVSMIGRSLWEAHPRPSRSRSILLAFSLCLVAVVTLGLWTALVSSRTLDGFENPIGMGNTISTSGSPADEALTGLAANLPPTDRGFIPDALATPFQPTTEALLTFVFLAGLGAALVAQDVRCRSLAWGVLVGSISSVLLIQTYLAFTQDRFFPEPIARYSIGLIPASLVLVAVFFQSRRELRVVGWATVSLCLVAGIASLHP